jgi:hypothetical protein
MQDLTVKRTLVKSPPELWSELSEAERLARHLDAFGEIKITRLEPESTVAWEGEGASGTVSIEPSGWGTKVTLTARVEGEDPPPPPEPTPESLSPPGDPEETSSIGTELQGPPAKRGWWTRLFARREALVAADAPVWVAGAPEPEPLVAEEPEPAPEAPAPELPAEPPAADGALTPSGAQAALESALEALGSAHHRPFSRG